MFPYLKFDFASTTARVQISPTFTEAKRIICRCQEEEEAIGIALNVVMFNKTQDGSLPFADVISFNPSLSHVYKAYKQPPLSHLEAALASLFVPVCVCVRVCVSWQ